MAVTIGEWSVGKGGTVISDTVPENYGPKMGHDDTEHYGGFLLAESVGNQDDAKLFAASKEMLEALKEAKRMYEMVQPVGGWQGVYDEICYAIKKATV